MILAFPFPFWKPFKNLKHYVKFWTSEWKTTTLIHSLRFSVVFPFPFFSLQQVMIVSSQNVNRCVLWRGNLRKRVSMKNRFASLLLRPPYKHLLILEKYPEGVTELCLSDSMNTTGFFINPRSTRNIARGLWLIICYRCWCSFACTFSYQYFLQMSRSAVMASQHDCFNTVTNSHRR